MWVSNLSHTWTARTCTFGALLAALVGLLAAGTTVFAGERINNLQVRVRSFATGADLTAQAQVEVKPKERLVATMQQAATEREVELRVSAPGFRPLETRFMVKADEQLPVQVWLDPTDGSLEALAQSLLRRLPPESGVIYGYLYNKTSGQPLGGARVALESLGLATTSDERGYFELTYPVLAPEGEDVPWRDTVVISAPGFVTQKIEGVLLPAAAQRFIEDLEPGSGVSVRDETPAALRMEEQEQHQTAPEPPAQLPLPAAVDQGPGWNAQALGFSARAQLVGMTPPSTIRVGTNCTGTSCSSVSVMSLESYVAAGLDEEWISSWNGHALRAGAIAYRSYGAWYVYHPLASNYDICSTTYCQVFSADVVTSTQQAANATAGFMLQRGGSLFRAEFSAENNAWDDPYDGLSCVNSDLSCGNGKAGSPANSWPCLSDSVCSNKGCFGHGRGMCQWGTSRWGSQGKLWNWITDHYYNANGAGSGMRTAYITSPITMPSFSPSPSAVSRGGTFTINLNVNNSAGLSHSQIMIGASIYSAASGYISDPGHDKKVSLAVGSNSVSRLFTVPSTAPTGSYNLIVSLWYDVDGDNAITSADLPLLTATQTGAITVTNPTTNIISDGDFEGGLYGSSNYGSSGTTGPWSWTSTGNNNPISQDASRAYAGSWLAWMNGYGYTETDTLRQTVTISSTATAATLSFYLKVVTSETTTSTAYDTLKVQVITSSGSTTTLATYSNLNASSGYIQRTFDLLSFKGQTITIKFVGQEDSSLATSFYIDNVALMVSGS
ncbi:hypothetical protein EG19_07285 [Thermoanaerobaculum aquaticum]|uniref:Sporulation stage II protein D amidase enhancer LytB N-terminal domain-containing protein n=2 Tax=Thermoanaerobaculum aquaticum TaxID=1312852 RepID=A0A062XYG1_9BACT|nr:SpoIID/LytB domain-containing protein [Thermoanaerobaculum aquaticum]KDA53171.1 hypothetical protein EG19_07285 [Thermoanaerobaculum aquaticum]